MVVVITRNVCWGGEIVRVCLSKRSLGSVGSLELSRLLGCQGQIKEYNITLQVHGIVGHVPRGPVKQRRREARVKRALHVVVGVIFGGDAGVFWPNRFSIYYH